VSRRIENISAETARALLKYTHIPDLF